MNFTNLRRTIGGAALTLAMLAGIGFATSGTAQAQYRRYDDRYNDQVRWDSNRTKQFAFLLGYHNAYTEGKEAADRGYRPNFRDMPGYRNSDNGYKSWMGHDDTYRENYRKGYETGFKDGQERRGRRYDRNDVERALGDSLKNVYGDDRYDRYDDRDNRGNGRWDDRRDDRDGRYDRNDRNQIIRMAQQNGYNDGIRRGQEDRSRRRGNQADRASEYRDGMRGYRSEYGDRNIYRQAYREGFMRGYDEAYRRGTTSRWPF
ncbi:MAG TPA: hypothetical protein VKC34_06565 [Blastocatellia bacterium]|nr:hypothetical protein [Blastocatellia bacterium]